MNGRDGTIRRNIEAVAVADEMVWVDIVVVKVVLPNLVGVRVVVWMDHYGLGMHDCVRLMNDDWTLMIHEWWSVNKKRGSR